MISFIVFLALIIGTCFIVIAGIGVLRMPDLYTRMHCSTKAGTVGLGLLLVAVGFFFGDTTAISRAIGIILFILMTAPVAAHLLGRAMVYQDYVFWRREKKD